MTETLPYIDITAQNFQAEVLERSRELPVLIDFWATWCAPCKTLGPLLEKLAKEWQGRFVLAKVDIDKNQELAEAFRVQSVPTVLLVKDGRPLDGFTGAQPEKELRAFLEPHLGVAAQDPTEKARELAEAGELEAAIELLREHLRGASDDDRVRIALAGHLVAADRAAEALKVFEKLSEEQRATPEAKAVQARIDLKQDAGDVEQLAAEVEAKPDDLDARIALGKALVAAGRTEEGLESLFEAALRDLHHQDDAPCKALLEVFRALGQEHPSTREYQQRLSVLLCS